MLIDPPIFETTGGEPSDAAVSALAALLLAAVDAGEQITNSPPLARGNGEPQAAGNGERANANVDSES